MALDPWKGTFLFFPEFSLQSKVTKLSSSLLSQHTRQSKYTLNLDHIQHRQIQLLTCSKRLSVKKLSVFYLNCRNIQERGTATPALLLAFAKFPEKESQDISQAAERMEMSIQMLKQKVCQKHKRSLHPTGKYSVLTLAKPPVDFLNVVF